MKMRFLLLLFCLGWAVRLLASIGIVDFGLAAGTNRFGCASDPVVFERALAPLGPVRRIPAERLSDTNAFSRATTDLLVIPCGSAFPAAAADALKAYLKAGGSFLSTGGYAFDDPVVRMDGEWKTAADIRASLPAGTEPVELLPASWWGPSTPEGYPARMVAVRGPDGSAGVEVRQDRFHFWVNAYMGGQPTNRFDGVDVISFFGRGGGTARRGKVELGDRDGKTRWYARFPVSPEWREYRLSAADFRPVSPPKDPANAPRFSFSRTRNFAIGVDLAGADQERPAAFAIASLRKGAAPRAASLARIGFPDINARRGLLRDAIHPREDQVGAFDPSFTFEHARIAGFPGVMRGYAAVAQLGPNGHGFSRCRCAWRELLKATSAEGTDLGPAAGIAYHFDSTFKDSAWALFGVTDRDLFASGSPLAGDYLRALAKKLIGRLHLNRTKSDYPCYRVGETATVGTYVANLGAKERHGTVRITLEDETGHVLARHEVPYVVKAGEQRRFTRSLPVEKSTPDFVIFTAEIADESGARVDTERGAFVVWNESVLTNGPKLERRGTHFALDGKVRFWTGAQSYWGQVLAYTARDPLAFDGDFRKMRKMGLRWTRQFFPWKTEWGEAADKVNRRFSDAMVQLAQKHGLVLYHSEMVNPNDTNGNLKAQNELFREIAARYREVPGFAIDVRNEPCMRRPSSRAAMEQERMWLSTDRTAAREGKPGVLVSVGHSQGWEGGRKATKDPAYGTVDLDFTDRHYYGDAMLMAQELKDVDQRALGKPVILGECGAKCHPTFRDEDAGGGDDEEEFANRFRALAARTFGLGGAAILPWHWRDPMEGLFPCGLLHATGVPRQAGRVFADISKVFGELELEENAPDVVVSLAEAPRADPEMRKALVDRAHAVDRALLYWGANWSKITDSKLGECRTRLILRPEELPTDDGKALRRTVGEKLKTSGCSFTRRPGDPESLETYAVPLVGGMAYVFWNDGSAAVEIDRFGVRFRLPSKRIGLVVARTKKKPCVRIL